MHSFYDDAEIKNLNSLDANNYCKKAASMLSVIVPVYNEAENVVNFYERTGGVITALCDDFEMIFINDGSTDNTLRVLSELAESDHRVKVIDLSRNFGKEVALTAGLDFAHGDAVIPIDVDMQDPPEIIPDMVAKWREGYDVVYATRSERRGESFVKRFTASIFYRIIGIFAKVDIPKDTGDFRIMDRKVVLALRGFKERHRFMKGLFSWVGFKQVGIRYQRNPRYAGKTKWNYWKLTDFAIEGITSFSYVPLQLATYLGLLVAFCAFAYGMFILILTLISGNPIPGYPSLIVIILFLGGVQLFFSGIIGEYIGRIYNEVKKRPLYLIQKIIDFSDNEPKEA